MKIDIVHTNDIHSNIEHLAKAGAIIEQIRATNCETMLVDSGDMITGDFQFKFNHGQAEIDISNYLKYDYVTVGNHDFDCGLPFLKAHMNKRDSQYIISNIIDSNQILGDYEPYVINRMGTIKIGYVSFFNAYLPGLLGENPQLSSIDWEQYQSLIDQVREQGADVVVSINHQGYETDIKLAQTVTGIDVIIGAHTHTKLTQPVVVEDTLIVQTGSFGQYLGHLSLEFEADQVSNYNYVLYDLVAIQQKDERLQSIIDYYLQVADSHADEVYGSCAHRLEGRREIMTKQSTNLGALICDSYLDYARKIGYNPHFALINARGLRQSIEPGEITFKQLYNVMPFEKTMVICNLLGSDLKRALDNKIELQTSNLRVVIDGDDKQLFDQSTDRPIEDDQIYQIATMNYIYEHSQFAAIQNGQLLARDISSDIEIVSSYIKKLGHDFEYQSNNMVETNE